jgi:1,4-alpha-glucan branching enzyme
MSTLTDLVRGQHHDPFEFLGQHPLENGGVQLRVIAPQCSSMRLHDGPRLVHRGHGLFEVQLKTARKAKDCILHFQHHEGGRGHFIPPWVFSPTLSDHDLHLIQEGKHARLWQVLGAHLMQHEDVDGTRFSVWAPNAKRISVVGDFNAWDGRQAPMRSRGASGVWELFIPNVEAGALYQFEILDCKNGLQCKADPMARFNELRPQKASVVCGSDQHPWQDQAWMQKRRNSNPLKSPLSILEIHAPSWKRPWRDDPPFHTWKELADDLVPWMLDMGYTHLELLPIMEHPLDDSWGYQVMGFFACSARHGGPEAFRAFVDSLHQAGIGIILDFVPAHFPKDTHGLARFDGSSLYEHSDPMRGEHPDWGTLIFDYGRREVCNFLIASALYWVHECHVDGLRVDAVASMLYLDYSRKEGEWQANQHGGRENLEAISFLRELNSALHAEDDGLIIAAEESTAWPMVTRPPEHGGLGFNFKWNMGWMHDTLAYMSREAVHRSFHQHELSFPMNWAFTENFILPLSHDEVVHGKGSLFNKMPGTREEKAAGLRALFAWMWFHPGRKLLFMGNDFGQRSEWNFSKECEWGLLQEAPHRGLLDLVRSLNHLLKSEPALHAYDDDQNAFQWLEADDAQASFYAFLRKATDPKDSLLAIAGFTPIPRAGMRVGLDKPGEWEVVFNSQDEAYAGWDPNTEKRLYQSQEISHKGHAHSIVVDLPPLCVLLLKQTR